jgi:hemin uptake protein HemP
MEFDQVKEERIMQQESLVFTHDEMVVNDQIYLMKKEKIGKVSLC